MKGYYDIRIRRASTGAVRKYSIHNHIMPGFYDILMAKSVSDNTNSVIDTLVFGDGVGAHSANATVLNGNIVYEKKYNDYNPPTNLSATDASTEFAHELKFNAFNTGEMLTIGEVAIGSRIGSDFVIASLTHIKDANGEPATLILMPGDEIDVTWTFIIARPIFLQGYEPSAPDYLVSNIRTYNDTTNTSIDYEMLTAYPNWHLMGLGRILSLIANRNSLITKTTWVFRKWNNTTLQWDVITPTLAQLKATGLYFWTDETDPLYETPKTLFAPSLLAPIKLSWKRAESSFGRQFTLRMSMNDLYTRWEASFNTPDSKTFEPKVVQSFNIVHTVDASNYYTQLQTTPYVIATVYKNGLVVHNLLADEFGNCKFTVPRRGLKVTDKYVIRAHVNGHQISQEYTYEVPSTDPVNMITSAREVTGGVLQYAPHATMFQLAPSIIGQSYDITVGYELIQGSRTYSPVSYFPDNLDFTKTISFWVTGEFKIGDKFIIRRRNSTTTAIVETFTYEVKSLNTTTIRKAMQSPNDQLLLKVKAYDTTV